RGTRRGGLREPTRERVVRARVRDRRVARGRAPSDGRGGARAPVPGLGRGRGGERRSRRGGVRRLEPLGCAERDVRARRGAGARDGGRRGARPVAIRPDLGRAGRRRGDGRGRGREGGAVAAVDGNARGWPGAGRRRAARARAGRRDVGHPRTRRLRRPGERVDPRRGGRPPAHLTEASMRRRPGVEPGERRMDDSPGQWWNAASGSDNGAAWRSSSVTAWRRSVTSWSPRSALNPLRTTTRSTWTSPSAGGRGYAGTSQPRSRSARETS